MDTLTYGATLYLVPLYYVYAHIEYSINGVLCPLFRVLFTDLGTVATLPTTLTRYVLESILVVPLTTILLH